MSKLIAFVSTAVAVLLLIGFWAYLHWYGPGGTIFHRDLDSATVVREVRGLNELVTVRYVVQKVVGLTEQYHPLGSESILLMVQGKVLAGIPLDQLTQYNVVSVKGRKVVLRLPPPHVVDVYLDEKNVKVWDRHVTWWTPWISPDPDLEHRARMEAIQDMGQAAKDMGILKDARSNGQEAIRKLLGALGMEVDFVQVGAIS